MYVEENYVWQSKNIVTVKKKIKKSEDILAAMLSMSKDFKDKEICSPIFKIPIELIYESVGQEDMYEIEGYYSVTDKEFATIVSPEKRSYYKIPNTIKFINFKRENAEYVYQYIYEYIKNHDSDFLPYVFHELIPSDDGQIILKLFIK